MPNSLAVTDLRVFLSLTRDAEDVFFDFDLDLALFEPRQLCADAEGAFVLVDVDPGSECRSVFRSATGREAAPGA